MERKRFEELVNEAVDNLPQRFKDALENIAILVADWPTSGQLESTGIRRKQDLWDCMREFRSPVVIEATTWFYRTGSPSFRSPSRCDTVPMN